MIALAARKRPESNWQVKGDTWRKTPEQGALIERKDPVARRPIQGTEQDSGGLKVGAAVRITQKLCGVIGQHNRASRRSRWESGARGLNKAEAYGRNSSSRFPTTSPHTYSTLHQPRSDQLRRSQCTFSPEGKVCCEIGKRVKTGTRCVSFTQPYIRHEKTPTMLVCCTGGAIMMNNSQRWI